MAGRFVRALVLIDYWNTQGGWNDHFRRRGQTPPNLPWDELLAAPKPILRDQLTEDEAFHDRPLWQEQAGWPQVRLVAGLTPVGSGYDTHVSWFDRHLRRTLGWEVQLYDNPQRPLDTKCRNPACGHDQTHCPRCKDKLVHYPEKRVDVDLATRMLQAAATKNDDCCDLIILFSGDTDFVPAVAACQDLGTPVACVAWKGAVNELMQTARFGTTLENTRMGRHLPA